MPKMNKNNQYQKLYTAHENPRFSPIKIITDKNIRILENAYIA